MLDENLKEVMTPEQREDLELQTAEALEAGVAELKFQTRDPFEDFLEQIDQDAERREATPEEEAQMDASLIKLGKVFAGSGVNWHLDGALNISLLKGEYIGVHKDVDVSIEEGELEEIVETLAKNNYGLFLSYSEDPEDSKGKKVMERVGAKAFSAEDRGHLMITAIDNTGKISEEEGLNFIDVHLVSRNESGDSIGYGGAPLPQEWFVGNPIEFKGEIVNVSHPAKVAFFKLHETRGYDQTDLQALIDLGVLELSDVEQIERSFEEEFAGRQKKGEDVIVPIIEKVEKGMDLDQVFQLFAGDQNIASQIDSIRPQVEELSGYIVEGHTNAEIIERAFALFGVNQQRQEQNAKIALFRKQVEAQKRIEEVREKI